MKLSDIKIGDEFSYAGMDIKNRVTDVGSRTIAYIRLDQDDVRNYNGPPYSICEIVGDEDDLLAISSITRPSTGEIINADEDEGFDFSGPNVIVRKGGEDIPRREIPHRETEDSASVLHRSSQNQQP